MDKQAEDDTFVRVAVETEHAVGFIEATLLQPSTIEPQRMMRDHEHLRVSIDALFVRRSHWRQGVGRRLVEAVESWAGQNGARVVVLSAHARSIQSLGFYEALGYDRGAVVFVKHIDG